VPPGHILEVKADGSRTERCFWSPEKIRPIFFRSDQEYADGLRHHLHVAVRRQTRSAHPIGCLLSGGLDSSAVAALTARSLSEKNGLLTTYTGMPRKGFTGIAATGCYIDPTPYVEAIRAAFPNVQPVYVHNEPDTNDSHFDRLQLAFQAPVRNPTNFGWYARVLQRARQDGKRVLLGGLLGNATISWDGWSQTARHLLRRNFATVYRQWRLYYRLTPYSRWTSFRKLCLEPILSPTLARAFGCDRRLGWAHYSAIRPDFAAATQVDCRASHVGHDFSYRMRPRTMSASGMPPRRP
jgi:asparagine synthase (glutamine-hydrolysing)